MKFAAIAAGALMLAGTASAKDVTIGGVTLSAGAEADMNYTTGVEAWALDFTPYIATEVYGFGLSVETTMDIMDLDETGLDGSFKGLEFGSSYVLTDGLNVYGEVATNSDLEFGDVKMGASFKF